MTSPILKASVGCKKSRSAMGIPKQLMQGGPPVTVTKDCLKKAMAKLGRLSPQDHMDGFKLIEPTLIALREDNPSLVYTLETLPVCNLLTRITVIMPHSKEVMLCVCIVYVHVY